MGQSLAEWKKKFWTRQEDTKAQSKFWMKDSLNTHGSFFNKDGTLDDRKFDSWSAGGSDSTNYLALGKYLRAVSNFVYIQTGDHSINVKFKDGDDSYTDGKTIVLSPKIKEEKFDVNVGLALHESGHIQYTDFKKFRAWMENHITEATRLSPTVPYTYTDYVNIHKTMWNFIEDRFIDATTFREAPGYRGYYKALYNEYFNDPLLVAGIYQPMYRVPTVDNYMFHILNAMNPQGDKDALPGLREILELIDIKNILRLTTTEERLALADTCAKVVLSNIPDLGLDETPNNEMGQGNSNKGGGDNDSKSMTMKEKSDNTTEDNDGEQSLGDMLDSMTDEDIDNMTIGDSDEDDDEDNDEQGSGSSDSDDDESDDGMEDDAQGDVEGDEDEDNDTPKMGDIELTPNQQKKLDRLIKKQIDLINENAEKEKKGKLSKTESELVNTIANADLDIHTVNDETGVYRGVPVIRVNRITASDLSNNEFVSSFGIKEHARDAYARYSYDDNSNKTMQDVVDEAIQRGRQLANKLRLRVEERVTDSTRRDSGRLDKRLLHQLGVGEYRVFKRTDIESFNDSYIHISIDASGSMYGESWIGAVTTAATIATAASIIKNIRVVISTRSTTSEFGGNETPYVLTVFDSKIDGIDRVRKLFPCLVTTGTTPEGLAFDAIMKSIVDQSANTEAFFINVSDGLPWASAPSSEDSMLRGSGRRRRWGYDNVRRYDGQAAIQHTKAQRMMMESHGVKIISYYINEKNSGSSYGSYRQDAMDNFTTMYGERNSFFIEAGDIFILAKTINQKLLEK